MNSLFQLDRGDLTEYWGHGTVTDVFERAGERGMLCPGQLILETGEHSDGVYSGVNPFRRGDSKEMTSSL